MLNHYQSQHSINLKKGDFIFSFDCTSSKATGMDKTDFNLKFSIDKDNKNNSFSLTNTNSTNNYRFNDNESFTALRTNNSDEYSYFNDKLKIINGKVYVALTDNSDLKNYKDYYIFNNISYVLQDNYSLCSYNEISSSLNSGQYIKRLNAQNKDGFYIRPVEMQQIRPIKPTDTGIVYYVDNNNIFDTNYEYNYKIIVSNEGKTISLWQKKKDDLTHKKIKTFSYENSFENAFVKLSIDDSMLLTNLSFSFFESNIS